MNPLTFTTQSNWAINLKSSINDVIGPFLVFKSQNEVKNKKFWNIDALVVADTLIGNKLSLCLNAQIHLSPELIHTEIFERKSKSFYLFHIKAPQEENDSVLNYELAYKEFSIKKSTISIPGIRKPLHFIATSCNGFSNPKHENRFTNPENVWAEIKNRHDKTPLHLMIGLGDQLYCDQVLNLPSIKYWFNIKNNISRFTKYQPSQEQRNDIDHYFFKHYVKSYTTGPSYSSCLSCIPQMNIWNDHDCFDGFGSYPDSLQNSPMFQTIGESARKYYVLFQLGVSPEIIYRKKKAEDQGFLSNKNYSFIKTIGNTTFFGLDSQGERTIHSIVPAKSWKDLTKVLKNIPSQTNHFIMLSASPLVFPNFSKTVNLLDFFCNPYRSNNTLAQITRRWIGTKFGVLNQFGSFSLKENDLWNTHKKEKQNLISLLKKITQLNTSVTILTGDSHCAGIACIEDKNSSYSFQKSRIYQIMTTPVGNIPASHGSKTMETLFETKAYTHNLNPQKQERFIKWGKYHKDPYFIQRRNWLDSVIAPNGIFKAQLHTEVKENNIIHFESFDYNG